MNATLTLPDTFEDRCAELEHEAAESFTHEDGSRTFVVYDDNSDTESPRDYDGNVATLIQCNSRCIDIDSDDAGLSEARDRFYRDEPMMQRYVAMFRPDIALYVDYWSAGDSYGWGYVTTEAWSEAFPPGFEGRNRDGSPLTPEQVFDSEVSLYRQWANGEVYGYVHVTPGQALTSLVVDFAPDDEDRGHEYDEDSVWGFLGYDSLRDIAAEATSSPVVGS